MARLVTTGFEVGGGNSDLDALMGITGTNPGYQSSNQRTGDFCLEVSSGDALHWTWSGVSGNTYFVRLYLRPNAITISSDRVLCKFMDATGTTTLLRVWWTTSNTLQVKTNAGTQLGGDSQVVNFGVYCRLELAFNIGAGAVDTVAARVDGSEFVNLTGQSISDTVPGWFEFCPDEGVFTAGSFSHLLDDVAINDSTGTRQNTWPGEGRVVLLKPASDNAVGTGWTLGTGTAISSNGFIALDNLPPIGDTDLAAGTDTKQIRNATANANTSYDANLTTYAAAGISAIDLINVLLPVVSTGSPVGTSAKQGTIGIASNPPIANIALSAGGTAGAFWSGTADGAWPTGWKWSLGTVTYAPWVSVATAPVARITQVTSSTRIAIVTALGMYVDYTERALAPPGPVHLPLM